ncbi:1-deoxy-D-xylulose-5-phosphate synthase [Patescibacteria group bacterium]|nr:1-deoxy-D-xylulose-5-phosphate synthase [Patescibacteria group bacterium]
MKEYNDSRDAVFQELYQLALNDKNVMLLSADTGAMMFREFKKNIPEQFYNVGIAEQNLISVAAGLALTGKRVFLFGLTNFLTLRCYEQIKIDLCCMNLPVTILGMGTGYVYSDDGPTHHMTEDVSIMRALPGMTIWNPSDYTMMASLVHLAYRNNCPGYIRLDKGPFAHIYDFDDPDFSKGIYLLRKGNDVTIISTGIMVTQAFKVADELEDSGIRTGIIDLYRLKPVNSELLIEAVKDTKRIVTLEEHSIIGGLGSIVCETLAQNGISIPVKMIGIPDTFRREAYDREKMRSLDGIDAASVITTIKKWVL